MLDVWLVHDHGARGKIFFSAERDDGKLRLGDVVGLQLVGGRIDLERQLFS